MENNDTTLYITIAVLSAIIFIISFYLTFVKNKKINH